MKNTNSSSLKLLGYSTMACGFLGLSQEADAQFLHFDYDPDSVVTAEIDGVNSTTGFYEIYADFELDLIRDGIMDASMVFSVQDNLGFTSAQHIYKIVPQVPNLKIAQSTSPWGGGGFAERFDVGEVVGSSAYWMAGEAKLYSFDVYTSNYFAAGQWTPGGVSGGLGLQYEISPGNYLYGYLRFKLNADFGGAEWGATMEEILWNMTPNQPLTVGTTPPAGDCDKPTALSATIIDPTSVTLNWTPDLATFKTQIQGRKTGTANFGNVLSTGTSRTFNSLTPGETYEWKARSICSSGLVSDMSPLSAFTMPPMLAAAARVESTLAIEIKSAGNRIELQSPSPMLSYALYASDGRLISADALQASNSAVLEFSQPTGVYFLNIITEAGELWQQFVANGR